MLEVYIDGASKGDPGPSGAGIFIKDGQSVEEYSIPLGSISNHEAEFLALYHALQICLPKKEAIISIRTDSQLVANAVEKGFVKNKNYEPLLKSCLDELSNYPLCFLKWIPSKENSNADRLAKQAIRQSERGDHHAG
ncbi:ribonuclease HI [Bacillus oleivorans]|uniref:Ribonuclease HI n=1 Tax=Bacillus oleivorans TaxID=1448271 RepID=A0A285CL01_9BACI|nr:RNase H family protein [Bacillus oleivorans]SNX68220.1 ribonuclease HI [Bacillus oleivorans]